MAIKEKTSDGWKIRAGAVSCPFAVDGVYETLDSTETAATLATKLGGTWEALPDRVEDMWKEKAVSYNNNAGTMSNVKCFAKVTEDKSLVELEFQFNVQVNSVSSTSAEIEVSNNLKIAGKSLTELNVGIVPISYADINNEAQTCSVYFNGGSSKLWFGANKTGGYYGYCTGRKLIAYNSAFAPDRTFKRFKRTA